ncbi:MAG: sigma-70 family RNA polymerase sigma factor [Polyangiaceae bacterium]|nr:sigma-70 family RNA polymerase sigma factor [Polyangiaceae bacterium]
MNLSAIFLSRSPADPPPAADPPPNIEETLAGLVAGGRAAWPEISVDSADFIRFVGRCVSADAASNLATLHASDLYLACAYSLGAPGAAAALERHCMSRVETALARIGTPEAVRADILQELRKLLVEMGNPERHLKGYSGRGALSSWLCVVAVRNARRRRENREMPVTPSSELLLRSTNDDPEMAYLNRVYKQELNDAFRAAVAELSSRDRNVLRGHFIEGLSIDRIGLLYGVHRATAARWINRACDALCFRTKEIFCQRVSLSQEGFHRILPLIQSQVRIQLASVPA